MGKRKKSDKGKILSVEEIITEEEKIYRLMFDFAHYLENLPRAPVGAATQLLREFLKEKTKK